MDIKVVGDEVDLPEKAAWQFCWN